MSDAPAAELIRTAVDADGVLLATIDMPGRTMNVFSTALMDALDALMARVDTDDAVKSVVLTSGKPSFLAGADLSMVRGYCDMAERLDATQMFEVCGRLGRQMVRLEQCAKPWVAAVNGLALGGGLELAMACRERFVADDPKVQLGLPEVRLGLLPGAGGTQRMPRLMGFEIGLDLLLSGKPIDPQRAVSTGLFARAVPAASLLDEARQRARALQGTPYRAEEKFAHLAQVDVPAHTPEVAQALALAHGIGAAEFARYPAYSAIVDCVLLGARQPLPEATATEMHQFLRLMFSPVAGNMIRTMFLNRQRADRESAAPEGLKIESVSTGTISPARRAWSEALAKSKLAVTTDASLPDDVIDLLDTRGAKHRVGLAVVADDDAASTASGNAPPLAVLSPVGPFGRVLEIVGADDATAGALAALAVSLRALPHRTRGARSALLAQAGADRDDADAQALAALDLAAEDASIDTDFHDVAACVAGVSPTWSGGPFTHLWREQKRLVGTLDARRSATWQRVEPALREARA